MRRPEVTIDMRKKQTEIITFKADPALRAALKGVANRSEFIRAAVLGALDSVCPLCRGTGILTANQQSHWARFAEDHSVAECSSCHERRLVCVHRPKTAAHRQH